MKTRITAWSYSRLILFESCPLLYKFRNIDKKPEPDNEAMSRGIKIHDEAAKFLAKETDILPESCKLFEKQMCELREMCPIVEQQWAFTKKYKTVSWFDKNTRLRIILDAGIVYSDRTADVIDHKTGKFRGDSKVVGGETIHTVDPDSEYAEQMALFAAGMFLRDKALTHVTTRLWYLDEGIEVVMEFTRAEAMTKLDDLEDRAEIMMRAKRFPPQPSWKCQFCHFRADSTGDCEFGG